MNILQRITPSVPWGWEREGAITTGIPMNTATIISAVARLIRRKLMGDLIDLFSVTASITSVFPTRLITISSEKNIANPVYIFLLQYSPARSAEKNTIMSFLGAFNKFSAPSLKDNTGNFFILFYPIYIERWKTLQTISRDIRFTQHLSVAAEIIIHVLTKKNR